MENFKNSTQQRPINAKRVQKVEQPRIQPLNVAAVPVVDTKNKTKHSITMVAKHVALELLLQILLPRVFFAKTECFKIKIYLPFIFATRVTKVKLPTMPSHHAMYVNEVCTKHWKLLPRMGVNFANGEKRLRVRFRHV